MIGAIVLAGGSAVRMGCNKLLLPHLGKTIIEHVVDKVLAVPLIPVIVVTGVYGREISQVLQNRPLIFASNIPGGGTQSASVRAAMELLPENTRAVLFVPGDLPAFDPITLSRIIKAYDETGSLLVIPHFQGRRGNPVLFDRRLFDELRQAGGDQGGRFLFARHAQETIRLELDDPGILQDIDRPEDYQRLLEDLRWKNE